MTSVDSFIDYASRLYAAYPTQTRLSVTYKKVSDKGKSRAPASNKVVFKCYNPRTGKVVRYSTSGVREVSKLLQFIGPRGVAKSDEQHVTGLASIMSNEKFEDKPEEPQESSVPVTEAPKSKKKKKKGKK